MTRDKICVYLFFLAVLILGSLIYKDYGISNDELFCHDLGTLNYVYVTSGNPLLFRYSDRDYPPFVETVLIALEQYSSSAKESTQGMIFFRHHCIFLFFVFGLFVFYRLMYQYFNSRWWGLLAVVILVLSPRLFGHAFFNSKDIPFMVFMILGTWSAMRLFNQPTLINAALHGIVSALAIDTRIGGVLIVPLTLLMLLVKNNVFKDLGISKWLMLVYVYLLIACLMTIAFFPMLWQNTIHNFINFFQSASHFRFPYRIFYMGQWVLPAQGELPWTYLPLWILSTVPLMVLMLFLMGALRVFHSILTDRKTVRIKPLGLWALLWFFVPLIIVIITNPTIYDGWRHFYFLYPAIIILALIGLKEFASSRTLRIMLLVLLSLNLMTTFLKMKQLHPYEHLYFNEISREGLKDALKKYQMDSWGVEFKEALDYIYQHDQQKDIKIYSNHVFAKLSLFILPPEAKERLRFVKDYQDARYAVFDYYFLEANKDRSSFGREIFKLNRQGVDLVAVYQVH